MSRSERALSVILREYATSWMTWVVVVLVLVVHLVTFCDQRIYWTSIVPIEVNGGLWRSNNLPRDRERVDRLTVSNGEIRHRADGDVSRFDDWSRLPRLKHLVIEGEALALTEPQLIEVLNRLELTSLSIRKLGTMSEAGWAALERQPLKILQIRSMDSTDATVIRLPKTVEILDLPYSSIRIGGDVDRSPLEILRELPHLATITLQTRMSPSAGLRAADRDILQNIPTLGRIYVDPHIAESIQRELPRVAVRPTGYQANRVTKAIGLLMVGTLAFFLILHFLSLQFATTSSALVPRFHAYHFGVALFILTLLLLTQFLGFLGNGFHPWASMALAGAIVIPSYVMTELSARSVRFAGFINVPSMGFAIIFSIMMLNLAIMSDRAEADWMFQGQRNQLVALLIAVEALCVLGFYRFFAR